MKKFIVTFGFRGDEGYKVVDSRPIPAEDEAEASITLIDQFESFEGLNCNVIRVKEVK
jgi:hypothetical protein